MERFKVQNAVIVMDLDDTLYKEDDYAVSGLLAVCRLISKLYGKDITEALFARKASGEADLLAASCSLVGLPPAVKETLLWQYRLHEPAIQIDASTRRILNDLECRGSTLVILTDGRAITQRLKLRALGLSNYPAYISEECGSVKPGLARFARIMDDYRGDLYIYIGDNPKKDFIGPNSLGWKTFGIRGDMRNVHLQDWKALPAGHLPHIWLDSLSDLLKYTC